MLNQHKQQGNKLAVYHIDCLVLVVHLFLYIQLMWISMGFCQWNYQYLTRTNSFSYDHISSIIHNYLWQVWGSNAWINFKYVHGHIKGKYPYSADFFPTIGFFQKCYTILFRCYALNMEEKKWGFECSFFRYRAMKTACFGVLNYIITLE